MINVVRTRSKSFYRALKVPAPSKVDLLLHRCRPYTVRWWPGWRPTAVAHRRFVDGRVWRTSRKYARRPGLDGGRTRDEKTPLVVAAADALYARWKPSPPISFPPIALAVSNMTDKRAAGVRPRGPRTPSAGRTDAGAPNMPRVRKNGTRIRRPGDDTGEKPSQVCGQSVRRAGVSAGGEGKKKITRRTAPPPPPPPDGCAQMLPMSHARSCASRVSPSPLSPFCSPATTTTDTAAAPVYLCIILRDGRQMARRLCGAPGVRGGGVSSAARGPGTLPVASEFFFQFFVRCTTIKYSGTIVLRCKSLATNGFHLSVFDAANNRNSLRARRRPTPPPP